MSSEIKVDTISENTSAGGVTIDGVLVKDNKVDVNGTAGGIILDADADTTISANTDDQIDFKTAGNATHVFDANGHVTLKQFLDATTAGGRITGQSNRGDVARINLYQHAGSADGGEIRLETADSSNSMTQRLTINETGHCRIDSEGTSSGGSDLAYSLYVTNEQASNANGIYYKNTGGSPDSNSVYGFVFQDQSTNRCLILSSGDILNHDGDYGQISDERIKQDIRDANSQWDDIKNIRIRNFKKKDDVRLYGDDAWEQIGVVAQELETICPKLIRKTPPSPGDIISDPSLGTLYTADDIETQGDNPTAQVGDIKEIKDDVKAVGSSILYMKAVKALQEAMARIETLEAEVTALKGE